MADHDAPETASGSCGVHRSARSGSSPLAIAGKPERTALVTMTTAMKARHESAPVAAASSCGGGKLLLGCMLPTAQPPRAPPRRAGTNLSDLAQRAQRQHDRQRQQRHYHPPVPRQQPGRGVARVEIGDGGRAQVCQQRHLTREGAPQQHHEGAARDEPKRAPPQHACQLLIAEHVEARCRLDEQFGGDNVAHRYSHGDEQPPQHACAAVSVGNGEHRAAQDAQAHGLCVGWGGGGGAVPCVLGWGGGAAHTATAKPSNAPALPTQSPWCCWRCLPCPRHAFRWMAPC